jgi:hypothetical protein
MSRAAEGLKFSAVKADALNVGQRRECPYDWR